MTEDLSVKEAAASKSERLSKDDLQYLMGLQDKAEDEIETEGDGENNAVRLNFLKPPALTTSPIFDSPACAPNAAVRLANHSLILRSDVFVMAVSSCDVIGFPASDMAYTIPIYLPHILEQRWLHLLNKLQLRKFVKILLIDNSTVA
ncbi:MAG: hypothetical protein ACRD4J_12115 [Nitrososphaeraceae archaeon]